LQRERKKERKEKKTKNKQTTLSQNLTISGVRSKTKGQEPYHYHQAILLDAQVDNTRQIKLRKRLLSLPASSFLSTRYPPPNHENSWKKKKKRKNDDDDDNDKTDLLNTRTQRNDGSYPPTLTLRQTFEARQTKAGEVHIRPAVSRSLRIKAQGFFFFFFFFFDTKGYGHNQEQF
jgi:hypothetical protein